MASFARLAALATGVAASMLLIPAIASAQVSAGISQSPARTADGLIPRAGLNGPVGPGISRMPLAPGSLYDRAVARAQSSRGAAPAITGTPGAVASSQEGGREVAGIGAEAFGTSTAPYTTARVAVSTLGPSSTASRTPVTSYPYRATGKIYARWGSKWYVCTGSLIKKSVLITAAHCVFNYGQKSEGWADEVLWYPANISANTSRQPYGGWVARRMYVPTPYVNGTDTCDPAAVGIVCNNDIATVVLETDSQGRYVGDLVGWYGYAWNGYSYRASPFLGNARTVQITQLGYPAAFDQGYQMQRTDAVGWYVQDGDLRNTSIGSAQTGGSSGGPWLVNFGTRPKLTPGQASLGKAAASNLVVGVTSYGYTTPGINNQGASFFGQNREYPAAQYGNFGAGNIGKLVRDTCTNAQTRAYC